MITDELAITVSRFVEGPMGPTASQLSDLVERVGLSDHDPLWEYGRVSKATRVERILIQARAEAPEAGWRFVERLLESLRACGAFRPGSENYPGGTLIASLQEAFKRIGYELSENGDLQPAVFGRINPEGTPEGVRALLERSRRNADDPALLSGGAKELIESVCRMIHIHHNAPHDHNTKFYDLLARSFSLTGLNASAPLKPPSLPERKTRPADFEWSELVRLLYELALAVNHFRNAHGVGHGRVEAPTATAFQASVAAEAATAIASILLAGLDTSEPEVEQFEVGE